MYNVKWRTYSNINYETIVILCNWGDGLKNVSPSHKFYLLPSTFLLSQQYESFSLSIVQKRNDSFRNNNLHILL